MPDLLTIICGDALTQLRKLPDESVRCCVCSPPYWGLRDYGTKGQLKRDVWTVAPANFPEAHFATYPPDLIKPCILAGSRVGDTVLDPFAGSGTTGQVAIELGRKAILIELNPKYVPLIVQRCNVTPGLALG